MQQQQQKKSTLVALLVKNNKYTFSLPQMWINPCAQVIFDSDPAPKDMSGPAAVEMMSQAMIRYDQMCFVCSLLQQLVFLGVFFCKCHLLFVKYRGMMDEEGNQFVAYFLPNEETLRKRKRDCEEGIDYMPDDL